MMMGRSPNHFQVSLLLVLVVAVVMMMMMAVMVMAMALVMVMVMRRCGVAKALWEELWGGHGRGDSGAPPEITAVIAGRPHEITAVIPSRCPNHGRDFGPAPESRP